MDTKSAVVLGLFLLSLVFVNISFGKAVVYAKRMEIALHKKWIDIFIVLVFCAVGLIEYFIRLQDGMWGSVTLYFVHLFLCTVSVAILFSMRFVWTGVRNKVVHRRLGKAFYGSFVLVAVTGTILLVQFFIK